MALSIDKGPLKGFQAPFGCYMAGLERILMRTITTRLFLEIGGFVGVLIIRALPTIWSLCWGP